MSKEDLIEFEGEVIELLPKANYRVKLENGHEFIGRFQTYHLTGWSENMTMTLWVDANEKYFVPDDLYLWNKLNPIGEAWNSTQPKLQNLLYL